MKQIEICILTILDNGYAWVNSPWTGGNGSHSAFGVQHLQKSQSFRSFLFPVRKVRFHVFLQFQIFISLQQMKIINQFSKSSQIVISFAKWLSNIKNLQLSFFVDDVKDSSSLPLKKRFVIALKWPKCENSSNGKSIWFNHVDWLRKIRMTKCPLNKLHFSS